MENKIESVEKKSAKIKVVVIPNAHTLPTRSIDLPGPYYDLVRNFLEPSRVEIVNLDKFVLLRGQEWSLRIYKSAKFGEPIAVWEPHKKPRPNAPLIRVLLVVVPGCLPQVYLDISPNLRNVALDDYDKITTTEKPDAEPIFVLELKEKMHKWFKLVCREK